MHNAKHNAIKKFSQMSDKEKDAHVNAGTGRRLSKAESAWKTRNWPKSNKPLSKEDVSALNSDDYRVTKRHFGN